MSSTDDIIVESFKIKRMRAAADLFVETLINYHCVEDKDVFVILEQEAKKHGFAMKVQECGTHFIKQTGG